MVETRSKRLAMEEAQKRELVSTSEVSPEKASSVRQPRFCSPSTSTLRLNVRSVFLNDWWLVNLHGNQLGIGGFASTQNQGAKCFTSAAISKRHSETVLETSDRIVIALGGLLNLNRTHQNGFPSKLYTKFIHGFPYNWKEYMPWFVDKEYANVDASMKASSTWDELDVFSGKKSLSASSSNDFPMTIMHDLCLLSAIWHLGDLFGDNDKYQYMKSQANATPVGKRKVKSRSTCLATKGSFLWTRRGVTTRSMSTMKLRGSTTRKIIHTNLFKMIYL